MNSSLVDAAALGTLTTGALMIRKSFPLAPPSGDKPMELLEPLELELEWVIVFGAALGTLDT